MSQQTTNLAVAQDPEDQVRADCYRVLARVFAAPPDAALLESLQQSASGSEDALGQLWNTLCQKVGGGDTATQLANEVAHIAEQYAELFTGIGEVRVLPYGSWYQTGSLMDFPLARLRTDLAKLGFTREADVKEPEDHIAALMEVMALLVADDNPEQSEFFTRHIAPWYLKFCARLAGEDVVASEFYRAAANFACGFLDGEAELMAP